MGAFIDLTGKKFGDWTVESYAGVGKWYCICSCGAQRAVCGKDLRYGKSISCGHIKYGKAPATFQDLSGQKFGRLLVVGRAANLGRKTMWECRCDCGKTLVVWAGALKNGNTKSCGCLRQDVVRQKNKETATHGLTHNRLYHIWNGMKNRCYNKNLEAYKWYGGRGITVCDEWRDDFKAFYDWAMANGYNPDAPKGKCTIDRIDVNGNYCPENCRWVDMRVQHNNMRTNVYIEIGGERKTITQWAKLYKKSGSVVWYRIHKLGWEPLKALETPYLRKRKNNANN